MIMIFFKFKFKLWFYFKIILHDILFFVIANCTLQYYLIWSKPLQLAYDTQYSNPKLCKNNNAIFFFGSISIKESCKTLNPQTPRTNQEGFKCWVVKEARTCDKYLPHCLGKGYNCGSSILVLKAIFTTIFNILDMFEYKGSSIIQACDIQGSFQSKLLKIMWNRMLCDNFLSASLD